MKATRVTGFSALALFLLLSSQMVAQNVVATIPVGLSPFIVAANPRTHRVYVTNTDSHTLSVIDGASQSVIDTVSLTSRFTPLGVAVNPITNRVYVAGHSQLMVFDGKTDALRKTIHVGSGADRIAVNTRTNRIYVTNENDGTVSVVDGATNQVIATVPIPGGPIGIGVNTQTNLIYAAPFFCNCGTVSVIDGSTNQVTTTFDLAGRQLDDIVVDPSENRIYVADEIAGMFVVDGRDNTLLANITGLFAPETVAIVPAMHEVVEADFGSGNAIFIDTSSFSITQEVATGIFPNGTAVDPSLRQAYVSNKGSNTVSVIAY